MSEREGGVKRERERVSKREGGCKRVGASEREREGERHKYMQRYKPFTKTNRHVRGHNHKKPIFACKFLVCSDLVHDIVEVDQVLVNLCMDHGVGNAVHIAERAEHSAPQDHGHVRQPACSTIS